MKKVILMNRFLSCRAGFVLSPATKFLANNNWHVCSPALMPIGPKWGYLIGYPLAKIEFIDDKFILHNHIPILQIFIKIVQFIPVLNTVLPENPIDMKYYFTDIKYFSVKHYLLGRSSVVLHIKNHSYSKILEIYLGKKCTENLIKILKEHKVKQQ